MSSIHSFAFHEKIDSGISLLKQEIVPGEAHLLISVGGCGADMIREFKGLINQNFCSDHDKHMAPERIAYIAFDTAANERDKVSSKATDRTKLTGDELTILSNAALDYLLDPARREYNKAMYPWIYRWLDTRISHTRGHYYCRQAGRVALFLEMERVVSKLKTTITNLITGTDVDTLNIYVLSSVSGGTGSAMFLDMAYIVRHIASEVIGVGDFKKTNIRILGYLLMPDVNLLNADAYTRPAILLNAGAALQELDHAMSLPETGNHYECQYSNTFMLRTNMRPFDYVHLISAKPAGASLPMDPYQHCLDTIANCILSLVSNKKYYDGRRYGGQQTPADSYYAKVTQLQNTASTHNVSGERSAFYLSIGHSLWQIYNDFIIKLAFTVVFDKMAPLFKNEPTQDDIWNLFDSLGLSSCQKVEKFMEGVRTPLNPSQFTAKQLFGKQAIAVEQYLPYDECLREINRAFVDSIEQFKRDIHENLQKAFVDPKKGPVWANHVVVQGAAPNVDALERLITEEKRFAIEEYRIAQMAADIHLANITKMRSTSTHFAHRKKCREYIEEWNNYFLEIVKTHCYGLLIGDTKTLNSLDGEYYLGFYDAAQVTTAMLKNILLNFNKQLLVEIKNVVRRNMDDIEKGIVPGIGPGLIDALGRCIPDDTQLMTNFLKLLLSNNKNAQMGGIVSELIEEFMEKEARDFFDSFPEGFIEMHTGFANSLSESVRENLMPFLIKSAKPLFDGNQDMNYAGFITIPEGCKQIEKGVIGYVDQNTNCNIKTSCLRNIISVTCTSAGISLHDYNYYEMCERQIDLEPEARGLFLNQSQEGITGRTTHM